MSHCGFTVIILTLCKIKCCDPVLDWIISFVKLDLVIHKNSKAYFCRLDKSVAGFVLKLLRTSSNSDEGNTKHFWLV